MNEKIEEFQKQMRMHNMEAYIIPTGDFHNSEYVSDYFKGREYLSGFTGSAGTLLVTLDAAYLWTDGRYFIQAASQLEGTGIKLMKIGEDESLIDFLSGYMQNKIALGFDGRLIPAAEVEAMKNKMQGVRFISDVDIVGEVWKERPELPFSLIYILSLDYAGKAYKDKLSDIQNEMKKQNADVHILSSLEDQAWLYNLRANDVSHTPVFLAFTMIFQDHTVLFTDQRKIDISVEKYLAENDIQVKPYSEVYDACKQMRGKRVLLNEKKVNYLLYLSVVQNNTIINGEDPSLLMKAIKNPTEVENIKLAHIKDGVAMTKFMYYVKHGFETEADMTELSVSDYLEGLRKSQKGFVDLSFDTICGFKEHGAMMHYEATKETDVSIKEGGFLLVDSGGHYLEGTTDITRTFALGPISNEMKLHYTTVLKSVIDLASAVFLKGCTGQTLDALARTPVWRLLLDYKCGTGHGVGYLLSVHESPNGFRYKAAPGRNESAVLVPGMITTDEPGIYLEGKYGIRTENELLCVEKGSNEVGTFYGFETITYCPIDTDAIQKNLLSQAEKDWLNDYHEMVYEKVSPYLTPEEQEWMKEATKKI